MAEIINQVELTKLIAAWNEYAITENDGYSKPQYKGLSLVFDAGDWREDHPEEFPEYCALKRKRLYPLSNRYDCSDWYLPVPIIKMVVHHEVSYETVSLLITLLLKEKDTKDQRVILPLPTVNPPSQKAN